MPSTQPQTSPQNASRRDIHSGPLVVFTLLFLALMLLCIAAPILDPKIESSLWLYVLVILVAITGLAFALIVSVNCTLDERRRARPVDREVDLEDQVDLYLIRAVEGVMQPDVEVDWNEILDTADDGQVTGLGYEEDRDSGYYSASRSGSGSGDDG